MKNLSVSIVIPCADDVRIKTCLDSIDEKVETIVVFNGATSEVKKIAKDYKVKTIAIPERNLAKALNIGIAKSKNKKVIFMDSDCRFEKGAIRKLYKGLTGHYVAKGKVIFENNNLASKIVAGIREYFYYYPSKPYNPFLAINKNIKKLVGNYFFDSNIYWTEDADLNIRLEKANIKVNYVFNAKIFHSPLGFMSDLRSAFRYGIGKRIRVETGKASGIGTCFKKALDIMNKKGIYVGMYSIVWNIFYTAGYFYQMASDPYKTKEIVH